MQSNSRLSGKALSQQQPDNLVTSFLFGCTGLQGEVLGEQTARAVAAEPLFRSALAKGLSFGLHWAAGG